ncbi:MAG: hypothetical protein GSR85_10060 [Desulfurococcales archaeon]|nr:hypothetical protein [Desulfurococcales archaeon]
MGEEQREKMPYVVYTVPPDIDPKTWADIQSRWVDVELRKIDAEKEKVKAYVELAKESIDSLKDYYLKKIPRITIPAYILIGAVVIGATGLTWLGKISGETFAFLMGTVVGYIISLLSKHM